MFHTFFDILYPPLCLVCDNFLDKKSSTLCSVCIERLELINPEERCQHCFRSSTEALCFSCQQHRTPLQIGAAFTYDNVASALVRNLKFCKRSDIAESLAAYLFLQVDRLGWPCPDLLVPVPMYWMRRFYRGYNQSYLLAKELEKLLGGNVRSVLQRRGGEQKQGGLNKKFRKSLTGASFQVRGRIVQDATVYLIDDVVTTGSTLNACAEVLLVAGAKEVRALSVCWAGF